MKTLYLILYIVSAVMFGIAAVTHYRPSADGSTGRINFIALGLLAWVLVPLIVTIDTMD